jgi:hypothetical protein
VCIYHTWQNMVLVVNCRFYKFLIQTFPFRTCLQTIIWFLILCNEHEDHFTIHKSLKSDVIWLKLKYIYDLCKCSCIGTIQIITYYTRKANMVNAQIHSWTCIFCIIRIFKIFLRIQCSLSCTWRSTRNNKFIVNLHEKCVPYNMQYL